MDEEIPVPITVTTPKTATPPETASTQAVTTPSSVSAIPATPPTISQESSALLQIVLQQQEKINKIYTSVERTRKMYLWTVIITLALFIIPAIILLFVAPKFISNYSGSLNLQNFGL